jgi:putative ABC transport system permease protein
VGRALPAAALPLLGVVRHDGRVTWAHFVLKNLARRPARTGLTVAGVALGVALIVALLSITEGVKRTAGDLITVGRSDFGLFQKGASDLTRSLLPRTLADRVAVQPGVKQVASIFLRVGPAGGRDTFLVFGLDPAEFPAQRLVLVEGRRAGPGEAMLGDNGARTLKLGVGDRFRIAGRALPIVGIYHSGNRFEDAGAVIPLAVAQAIAERPGEVTTIAVEVALGSTPDRVAKALERRYDGLAAVTEPGQAVKVDTSSRLILSAGWIFSLVALIIGGVAVTNTMAMSVFERFREIGVLRAIGWKGRSIAALILGETVAIGLLALGVGLGLGWLGAVLFTSGSRLSSLASAQFTAGVFGWGLAFALGVAVFGAIYPTWIALRLRPIEALRFV